MGRQHHLPKPKDLKFWVCLKKCGMEKTQSQNLVTIYMYCKIFV